MGKSPGKWIKGIFGKKTSKSNLSKGSALSRCASEKPAQVSSKEPVSTLISSPVLGTVVDKTDKLSFDEGEDTKLTNNGLISSFAQQDGDTPENGLPNDSEKIRLEQAATVVQASFRSYQARHVFQTLKAVTKLQAVARAHLVRRQAISTLFCVQGIVKLQAITRGFLARKSSGQCKKQSLVAKDASCEIKCRPAENLLKNAFINELLSSSPNAMPLHIQYGPGEPNSACDWLLRWSISHFWTPKSKSKDYLKLRTSENVGNDPNQPNAETDKRKDKAKRGPKKNPKPNEAENDNEKPKKNSRKLSKSPIPKFSERKSITPTDKPVEILVEASEKNDAISNLETSGAISNNLSSHEHHKLVGDKNGEMLHVDKDHKSSRRISLPAKNDDQDATCENVTRVPSYMLTTASSKAKVKAQKSPRFEQDAVDKNDLTRRHSLPSSINGKMSLSPRVHRLVQANGRDGKIDASVSSSRDITDKATQEDWKR